MSLSTNTQIAQWAQSNAASHGERHAPQHDEPLPVLLTPAIALATASVAGNAAMVGMKTVGHAHDGYQPGEISAPKVALDTGRSINSTLDSHPYSY